jgi:hypothetical protein
MTKTNDPYAYLPPRGESLRGIDKSKPNQKIDATHRSPGFTRQGMRDGKHDGRHEPHRFSSGVRHKGGSC